MSEEKKNKPMSFITGISLGLVIGGSIVYFSLNTNIVRYPLEVSQNTIESIVDRVLGTISSRDSLTKDSIPVVKEKNVKPAISRSDSTLAASQDSIYLQEESLTTLDTLYARADSSEEEIITIRKDELLTSRTLDVINFSSNGTNKDSLLAVLAGIQPDKRTSKKFTLMVEFWKSPLNYRGYKLTRNKLTLFGLDPNDKVKLILFQDTYYLKTSFTTYRLQLTDEFIAYEKFNNLQINSLFTTNDN